MFKKIHLEINSQEKNNVEDIRKSSMYRLLFNKQQSTINDY